MPEKKEDNIGGVERQINRHMYDADVAFSMSVTCLCDLVGLLAVLCLCLVGCLEPSIVVITLVSASKLSLFCTRLMVLRMATSSTIGPLTRPTQPSICI